MGHKQIRNPTLKKGVDHYLPLELQQYTHQSILTFLRDDLDYTTQECFLRWIFQLSVDRIRGPQRAVLNLTAHLQANGQLPGSPHSVLVW